MLNRSQTLGFVSVREVLAIARTCKALRHTATANDEVWANLCRTLWCIDLDAGSAASVADSAAAAVDTKYGASAT